MKIENVELRELTETFKKKKSNNQNTNLSKDYFKDYLHQFSRGCE